MFTTDHTTNFGEKPHRGKNGKNLSQLRKKKEWKAPLIYA
jgi:hypothetical protein